MFFYRPYSLKKDGVELEGGKEFSKIFMKKHGVPTAKYKSGLMNDNRNPSVAEHNVRMGNTETESVLQE